MAKSLQQLITSGEIAPDWEESLAPVAGELTELLALLDERAGAGESILPARADLFASLRQPLACVRAVILGQDPYPTPGHPIGLSFAVSPRVKPLPGSLRNIFQELQQDIGAPPPATGDLTPWTEQGVLLLNRVLTVSAGKAGSHRGLGWEQITSQLLRAVGDRDQPLAGILWGNDARAAAPLLGEWRCVISAHPSPLAAHRGFFGSRPFSRANELLSEQGADPINWALPSAALL